MYPVCSPCILFLDFRAVLSVQLFISCFCQHSNIANFIFEQINIDGWMEVGQHNMHTPVGYRPTGFCRVMLCISAAYAVRLSVTFVYSFGFVFVNVTAFRRSKSISKPNFVEIYQLAAEIWLLPVSKYKRPLYWNSTSGFDLYHFSVIGVSFHIWLPNFVQNGTFAAEIWRHFQDGGHQPCCICFGVMADHPRSAFFGLNCDFKSLVRRNNSSGDIAM